MDVRASRSGALALRNQVGNAPATDAPRSVRAILDEAISKTGLSDVGDDALAPIVYIIGLERSGTTILHNLFALHRSARALLRSELMEPVPPPTTETHASDPRIAAVQASVEPLQHWSRRLLPVDLSA